MTPGISMTANTGQKKLTVPKIGRDSLCFATREGGDHRVHIFHFMQWSMWWPLAWSICFLNNPVSQSVSFTQSLIQRIVSYPSPSRWLPENHQPTPTAYLPPAQNSLFYY